jgi:uncharacterized membrane protein (UPF0127 family)
MISRWQRYLSALLLCWITSVSYAQEAVTPLPEVTVVIKELELSVEYAHTFEQRAQGLMYRQSLCDQCGMLFRFDSERMVSMWMKNTFVPLDVAFITKDGNITDIKPMYPLDLTPTGASKPVLYALEMNQGWFARNNIVVGDHIRINP